MQRKFLLVLFLGLLAISFNVSAESNTNSQLVSLPDFAPIYEEVGQSVVSLSVTQIIKQNNQAVGSNSGDPFEYFYQRQQPRQRQYKATGIGTGFIVSSDGYILTNAHVVANSEEINVRLQDKREYKAKIVGVDKNTDIAVIKIDESDLAPVKIGDPKLMKPGNWVLAIGAPFGLENTITQGIISALSRDLPDDSYIPFLQTDVPINPGNSGGPLINLNGEVVGINSQIYSKSGGYMGISFSIPIDYAIKVADQLRTTGRVARGRLGIALQMMTPQLAKSFGLKSSNGVLVNSVEAGSGADQAGIKVGDVILKANGKTISEAYQLPRIVAQLGPNQQINLVIWRDGSTIDKTVTTTLAVEVNSPSNAEVKINNKINLFKKLGVVVSELKLEQLPKGIKYAVVIKDVSQNTQFAGAMPGDLIVGFGNNNFINQADANKKLENLRVGQSVALKIIRNDGKQLFNVFVPVTVE